MNIQKARDWADLVLKVTSIAAIIAAGAWAYYQFWVTDTTDSNIQLGISTEVLPYSGNNRLLLIHVRPKNIGKVLVSPEHLTVSIKDLPTDLKPGAVDLRKLKERYSTDILDNYKDGYDLEPGVLYDEVVALVVPKGIILSVYGEVDFESDYEVDQTAVVTVK